MRTEESEYHYQQMIDRILQAMQTMKITNGQWLHADEPERWIIDHGLYNLKPAQ